MKPAFICEYIGKQSTVIKAEHCESNHVHVHLINIEKIPIDYTFQKFVDQLCSLRFFRLCNNLTNKYLATSFLLFLKRRHLSL